jgi:hypothetical protein
MSVRWMMALSEELLQGGYAWYISIPLTFFSSPVGTPACFTLSAAHDDAASALPTLANPAMHWRIVTIVFGGRLDSFSVVYASR